MRSNRSMRSCKSTFGSLLISSLILSSLSFLPITIATPSDPELAAGHESEFTYIEGTDKGPSNWGKLNPNWTTCGSGKLQSPIDVTSGKVVKIKASQGNLTTYYKPAKAVLKNRGHDIMVSWENQDAGKVNINGTDYKLIQCHWHSPSEHVFNKSKFNMEIHLVHSSDNGETAVIGIVYKFGKPDPFLSKLLNHIRESEGKGEEGRELGIVNPIDLDIDFWSKGYYRYIGSLTTPPCTEGVIWTILNKVKTVSRKQLETLRDAVHDGFESNARPTQNLNGRSISFYSNQ